MANYSVNQSRQVYVAVNATSYALGGSAKGQVTKVVKTAEDNKLYFLFNGAKGVLRSDDIDLATLKVKVIDATKNVTTMKKLELTLDSNINSGDPVVGQDYVLGINFKNFFSSGDASEYYKDAAVHVTSDTNTASKFYIAMMKALNKAFAREDGATATSNPYLSFKIYDSYSSSEQGEGDLTANTVATKILIEEKPQEWVLGTKKARRITFDLFPQTIYTGGSDVIWGVVAAGSDATTVGNGQNVADLEWFGLGERGDQYRNVGWPNVIPTVYLTDPTKQYDLLEFHYAFTDSGVGSYRTEKEITIAAPYDPTGGNAAAKHASMNLIIGAINSAYGSTLITAFS